MWNWLNYLTRAGCESFVGKWLTSLKCFVFRIVKVNNYLSFAGLHLFLQTQLPIQEIEGFLEGKYGENASVEDLIHPTTLSNLNEDKKTLYECSNEDCTLLTSSNWDIPSTDNASTHCGSYEVNSDRLLSDSYSTSSGYLSSSAENSSFMYTMYRWLWSKSLNILFGFLGFFFYNNLVCDVYL